MKKMLICALCLALAASPALAVPDGAALGSTRSFLELLDGYGLRYAFTPAGGDGDERVDFTASGENVSAAVTIYFDAGGAEADIRCWSLVEYAPDRLQDALSLCNALNMTYRWARFYADTGDDTVNAAIDLAFTDADAAQLTMRAAAQLAQIVDDAWPELAKLQ